MNVYHTMFNRIIQYHSLMSIAVGRTRASHGSKV